MATLSSGTRVRQRREELGITREQLGHAAGVSVSTIARLELSDKLPTTGNLLKIARVLDLSLDEVAA